MANSRRHRKLIRRLSELRKHFLPNTFSAISKYSKAEEDHARAYKLLAHAEIEAFIEDVAWGALKKQTARWRDTRKPNDLVICFVLSYQSGESIEFESGSESEPITTLSPKTHARAVAEGVDKVMNVAVGRYKAILNNNHGVKEENLRRLLIPIGVRFEDIDASWLEAINSFAAERGDLAHKSIGMRNSIDPQVEYGKVSALLPGIAVLDALVTRVAR